MTTQYHYDETIIEAASLAIDHMIKELGKNCFDMPNKTSIGIFAYLNETLKSDNKDDVSAQWAFLRLEELLKDATSDLQDHIKIVEE
jgi:hypothetical protein